MGLGIDPGEDQAAHDQVSDMMLMQTAYLVSGGLTNDQALGASGPCRLPHFGFKADLHKVKGSNLIMTVACFRLNLADRNQGSAKRRAKT